MTAKWFALCTCSFFIFSTCLALPDGEEFDRTLLAIKRSNAESKALECFAKYSPAFREVFAREGQQITPDSLWNRRLRQAYDQMTGMKLGEMILSQTILNCVRDTGNMESAFDQMGEWLDFSSVRQLHLPKCGIRSTEPFKQFPNLYRLDLHDNPLSDVSALRDLRLLRMLGLSYTEVSSLTEFEGFPPLDLLILEGSWLQGEISVPMGIHIETLILPRSVTGLSCLRFIDGLKVVKLGAPAPGILSICSQEQQNELEEGGKVRVYQTHYDRKIPA